MALPVIAALLARLAPLAARVAPYVARMSPQLGRMLGGQAANTATQATAGSQAAPSLRSMFGNLLNGIDTQSSSTSFAARRVLVSSRRLLNTMRGASTQATARPSRMGQSLQNWVRGQVQQQLQASVIQQRQEASQAPVDRIGTSQARLRNEGVKHFHEVRANTRREGFQNLMQGQRDFGSASEAWRNYRPVEAGKYLIKGMANTVSGVSKVSPGMGLMMKLATILPAVIIAFAALPKKIRDFGDAILQAQRPLAEYNGRIASAFARLDANRLGRTMQLGRMTSASTVSLAKSLNQLEQKLLPLVATGVNLLNRIASATVTATGWGYELAKLGFTTGTILRILELWNTSGGNAKDARWLADISLDMAKGAYNPRRKPPAGEAK